MGTRQISPIRLRGDRAGDPRTSCRWAEASSRHGETQPLVSGRSLQAVRPAVAASLPSAPSALPPELRNGAGFPRAGEAPPAPAAPAKNTIHWEILGVCAF